MGRLTLLFLICICFLWSPTISHAANKGKATGRQGEFQPNPDSPEKSPEEQLSRFLGIFLPFVNTFGGVPKPNLPCYSDTVWNAQIAQFILKLRGKTIADALPIAKKFKALAKYGMKRWTNDGLFSHDQQLQYLKFYGCSFAKDLVCIPGHPGVNYDSPRGNNPDDSSNEFGEGSIARLIQEDFHYSKSQGGLEQDIDNQWTGVNPWNANTDEHKPKPKPTDLLVMYDPKSTDFPDYPIDNNFFIDGKCKPCKDVLKDKSISKEVKSVCELAQLVREMK